LSILTFEAKQGRPKIFVVLVFLGQLGVDTEERTRPRTTVPQGRHLSGISRDLANTNVARRELCFFTMLFSQLWAS